MDLTEYPGDYHIQWYNPRTGGDLKEGSAGKVRGGGKALIGAPPADPDKDWAVIIKKI